MSGNIFVGSSEYFVQETTGVFEISILRSGDTSAPIEITYSLDAESATGDVDFRAPYEADASDSDGDGSPSDSYGVAVLQPGESLARIPIPILDDAISEPTESFVFNIVSISAGELLAPRTARVFILDNENPAEPTPEQPPLESDFDVSFSRVADGLTLPIDVEFSPVDQDIAYIAEKGGTIRVLDIASGNLRPSPLLTIPDVNDVNDRGLLSIAFHPDFAANPYLYAFYVVDPPGAFDNGRGNRYAHLVRYTLAEDALSVAPGSKVVLIGATGQSADDISGGGVLDFTSADYAGRPPSDRVFDPDDLAARGVPVVDGYKQDYIKVDSATHAGGSLAFGPDGALYIGVGDGAAFNFVDRRTVSSQSLDSLAGKILRVDPITGLGLPDNPFVDDPDALHLNRSKVYQLGVRNPFSMAVTDSGAVITTDTGWNSYEEVNKGGAGANFGWPFYEGADGGNLFETPNYSLRLPQESEAFYAGGYDGVMTPPYRAFSHVDSEPGYQFQAITGGGLIYDGTLYPESFQNDYFFTDFVDGEAFAVDASNPNELEFLFDMRGWGVVDYAMAPNGEIWFSDIIGGAIRRLHIEEKTEAADGRTRIGEAGALTIAQPDRSAWTRVAFEAPLVDPVVVAGPLGFAGGQPATIRVRNVDSTGFDVQVAEWAYLDGFHVDEALPWLAVERGVHRLSTGGVLAAGVSDVGDVASTASFGVAFDAPPIVLTQVASANDPAPVTTQVESIGLESVGLSLIEEEAADGFRGRETVGWIAADAGIDLPDLRTGRTAAAVSDADATIPLGETLPESPIFVADAQSAVNPDPSTLRLRNLDASGATLFAQEETSLDPETDHVGDEVGWILAGDGGLRVPLSEEEGGEDGSGGSASGDETGTRIGEAGRAAVTQAERDLWTRVAFRTVMEDPVVIAGPIGTADVDPATVRIRDVDATGFDIQISEWAYLDGAHGPAEIPWLALERGVHRLADGGMIAVGETTADHEARRALFDAAFEDTPVVFGQVTSANDSAPVASRLYDIDREGFTHELDEEEAADGVHALEELSWIAIDPGVALPGISLGQTAGVTSEGADVAFPPGLPDSFAFLADMQTRNGGNPATLRLDARSAQSARLAVAEEQSLDAETGHIAEDVGWLTISTAEIRADLAPASGGGRLGEAGRVVIEQPDRADWTRIDFAAPMADPIVVAGPPGFAGPQPATVRIRDVDSTGFEMQISEWAYLDGVHVPEEVSWLAVERGVHQLADGGALVAGDVAADHSGSAVDLGLDLGSAPVVFAQTTTVNDPAPVTDRLSGVSSTGFTVRLDEEEAADGLHAVETVDWIAFRPGSTAAAGVTGPVATHAGLDIPLPAGAPDGGAFLADMQTLNGGNPAALRLASSGPAAARLVVQEEQSLDPETDHIGEAVGWAAFAQGSLDGLLA